MLDSVIFLWGVVVLLLCAMIVTSYVLVLKKDIVAKVLVLNVISGQLILALVFLAIVLQEYSFIDMSYIYVLCCPSVAFYFFLFFKKHYVALNSSNDSDSRISSVIVRDGGIDGYLHDNSINSSKNTMLL